MYSNHIRIINLSQVSAKVQSNNGTNIAISDNSMININCAKTVMYSCTNWDRWCSQYGGSEANGEVNTTYTAVINNWSAVGYSRYDIQIFDYHLQVDLNQQPMKILPFKWHINFHLNYLVLNKFILNCQFNLGTGSNCTIV